MAGEQALATALVSRHRGVPPEFIEQLIEIGIPMGRGSIVYSPVEIAAGSPRWVGFVELLQSLPPTNVDILLTLTGPDDVFVEPAGAYYMNELVRYLPTLSPGCNRSLRQHVSGVARTLIEAVVRTLEDPPACCPTARLVPEGHYIASLEMEFANLLLFVNVKRRSKKTTDKVCRQDTRCPLD